MKKEELKLGAEEKFEQGDRVEVRDKPSDEWKEAIFICFNTILKSEGRYIVLQNGGDIFKYVECRKLIESKKGILILGGDESGKTTMAWGFCRDYPREDVLMMYGNGIGVTGGCVFKECEAVIYDDVDIRDLHVLPTLTNGVKLKVRGQEDKQIYPQIIVTMKSDTDINEIIQSNSLKRRFDIFICSKQS